MTARRSLGRACVTGPYGPRVSRPARRAGSQTARSLSSEAAAPSIDVAAGWGRIEGRVLERFWRQTVFATAHVRFECHVGLEAMAAKISSVLLGGRPFQGREDREEIPALCVEPDVLGFHVVLMQEDPDNYWLEVTPTDSMTPEGWEPRSEDFFPGSDEDLSAHFAWYIQKIEGVTDVRCGLHGESPFPSKG